ncbi:MAG: glycosyltransferase family 39 protein [Candidatus Nomurabacteria bacterium]|jgi:hypothetical protein|nr:glycosyltransferase family 39 protein [Candidatus Nomurabacteria bacterium]
MKSDLVRQITLYKYRYIAGFGVLLLFILAVITWRFWLLPDGLSSGEMAAATSAGHFSLTQILDNVVNLPWTVLEWLSIKIFGASTFAFRLPAVILMTLSAGGLVMLLRKWSRDSIAVISSFLIITSVLFVGLSRSGTPAAMTTFLIIMIILSALTIIRSVEKYGESGEKNRVQRNWQAFLAKVIICIAMALLCYQAAGIYLAATFIMVGMLHPKTRLIFIKSKPWKIIVGALAAMAVMAPLIIGLMAGGSAVMREWLVLSGTWSLENLSAGLSAIFRLETGFTGGFVTPMLTLVGLIIALIGLMKICTNVFSARSHLVLPFLLVTLILTVWQLEMAYLLLMPLALLVVVGIETLIRSWYNLFPRNPYARLLAVVTLAILLSGLVWASMARYIQNHNYNATVIYHYSQEYSAVRTVLAKKNDVTTLIVAPDNKKFYDILQNDFPNLKVMTELKEGSHSIVLGSANIQNENVPTQIVTSWRRDGEVLLRVY